MSSKILLSTIRANVGNDTYWGWVKEARSIYDARMKDAKHRDLNGQSATRQPRTSFIGQYVSREYSAWKDARPNQDSSGKSPLEQVASEA